MAQTIATPNLALPLASLFSVPSSHVKARRKPGRRPSKFFWTRATAVSPNGSAGDAGARDAVWLDEPDAPALSESEDGDAVAHRGAVNQACDPRIAGSRGKSAGRRLLTKIRSMGFKGKGGKNVQATEVLTAEDRPDKNGGSVLFQSLKFKTRGAKTEVQRLVAVVKKRVSKNSPDSEKPKTWEEYNRLYAAEQIDVSNPPLPPTDPGPSDAPTPYQNRFYIPPRPATERVRQLIVNRLGVFGPKHYDASDSGADRAKSRAEAGDQLEAAGKAPEELRDPWEAPRSSTGSSQEGSGTGAGDAASECGIQETKKMLENVRKGRLPPETLEQHPVFRRIVKQCREMFNTSISMLTIMDDDRQVFLAEAGLNGMRDVPRDITFCAHTILAGRKGFTILDTHAAEDWRWEQSPLVQAHHSRFYAGVPLMAPNLSGDPADESASMPLGTLCVVDDKPRDSFGAEERRKLVYMAEYARREIERWFLEKMEVKQARLDGSHEVWEAKRAKAEAEGDVASIGSSGTANLETLGKIGAAAMGVAMAEGQAEGFASAAADSAASPPGSPGAEAPKPGTGPGSPARPAPTKRKSLVSLRSRKPPPAVDVPPLPTAKSSSFKTGPILDGVSSLTPKLQRVCDLATSLIGETLELSLAYLLAVGPEADGGAASGRTRLLSSYNLPDPAPAFDPILHLKAMTAPERGLLYQNPTAAEQSETGEMPKGQGDSYASAILVPVGEERPGKGGFVLAAFTSDAKRVFAGEDVAYLRQFAKELEKYCNQIAL